MNPDRIIAIASILFALMGSALPATKSDIRADRHAREARFNDCYVPCIEKAKK